jgi:hypothetical protein
MKLTTKQKEVIVKIENLLNIKILDKCSAINKKAINYSNFTNLEAQRNYIDFLNISLINYNFCKIESNGCRGIAIILN